MSGRTTTKDVKEKITGENIVSVSSMSKPMVDLHKQPLESVLSSCAALLPSNAASKF